VPLVIAIKARNNEALVIQDSEGSSAKDKTDDPSP